MVDDTIIFCLHEGPPRHDKRHNNCPQNFFGIINQFPINLFVMNHKSVAKLLNPNIFLLKGRDKKYLGFGSTAHWNLIVETPCESEDTKTVVKYDAVFDKDQKILARKEELSLTDPVQKRWPKAEKSEMTTFSLALADAYMVEVNQKPLSTLSSSYNISSHAHSLL